MHDDSIYLLFDSTSLFFFFFEIEFPHALSYFILQEEKINSLGFCLNSFNTRNQDSKINDISFTKMRIIDKKKKPCVSISSCKNINI